MLEPVFEKEAVLDGGNYAVLAEENTLHDVSQSWLCVEWTLDDPVLFFYLILSIRGTMQVLGPGFGNTQISKALKALKTRKPSPSGGMCTITKGEANIGAEILPQES